MAPAIRHSAEGSPWASELTDRVWRVRDLCHIAFSKHARPVQERDLPNGLKLETHRGAPDDQRDFRADLLSLAHKRLLANASAMWVDLDTLPWEDPQAESPASTHAQPPSGSSTKTLWSIPDPGTRNARHSGPIPHAAAVSRVSKAGRAPDPPPVGTNRVRTLERSCM